MQTFRLTLLVFPLCLGVYAEEGPPAAGFPKLQEKVESLGFPALAAPLKLYGEKPPALSENGTPEVPDLALTYAWDETKKIPEELAVELTAADGAPALAMIEKWTGQKPNLGKLDLQAARSCSLKFSGLAAVKLADLQFVQPLEGDKKKLKECRLAFSALTAKKVTFQAAEAGKEPVSVVTPVELMLGGEYRPMNLKAKKKRVMLNEEESVAYLGKKPKDPTQKRVSLAFPKPESGEDPSTLLATAGAARVQCEIVLAREPQTPVERRQPRGWVFRDKKGETAPEIILPSQFDGKEALGAFVQVLDQKKDPFLPRTRELTLEVIVLEVTFGPEK
jgi:hypothetical protein